MSDTDKPTEPIGLTDGEKAVAAEAIKSLLSYLLAHGKAVSLVRYAVLLACGHEATVNQSTLAQAAAWLVGAAMVAWGWWERHQAAHKALSQAEEPAQSNRTPAPSGAADALPEKLPTPEEIRK